MPHFSPSNAWNKRARHHCPLSDRARCRSHVRPPGHTYSSHSWRAADFRPGSRRRRLAFGRMALSASTRAPRMLEHAKRHAAAASRAPLQPLVGEHAGEAPLPCPWRCELGQHGLEDALADRESPDRDGGYLARHWRLLCGTARGSMSCLPAQPQLFKRSRLDRRALRRSSRRRQRQRSRGKRRSRGLLACSCSSRSPLALFLLSPLSRLLPTRLCNERREAPARQCSGGPPARPGPDGAAASCRNSVPAGHEKRSARRIEPSCRDSKKPTSCDVLLSKGDEAAKEFDDELPGEHV